MHVQVEGLLGLAGAIFVAPTHCVGSEEIPQKIAASWASRDLLLAHVEVELDAEARLRSANRQHAAFVSGILGGILLGWGSMTSLGCTIGVLLSGTQAFALSGWVFFAFVFLGSYVGIKLKFHTTG